MNIRVVGALGAALLLPTLAQAQDTSWKVRGVEDGKRFLGTLVVTARPDGRYDFVGKRTFEDKRTAKALVGILKLERSAVVSHYRGQVEERGPDAGVLRRGVASRIDSPMRTTPARTSLPALSSARSILITRINASNTIHGRIEAPRASFQSLPETTKRKIVLVHGAWVDARSWGNFKQRYEAAGYDVLVPEWPGHKTARAGDYGPTEIVDHYAKIIRKLSAPPILIGHSFGGLWVQLLLDRGLGAAGVAIDSAPTFGVPLKGKAKIANAPAVLGSLRHDVLSMAFKDFQYGFVHKLPLAEQRAAYEAYVVPTTSKVFKLSARLRVKVDYGKADRAPLLLIAGSDDRTVTAAMNRWNYRLYRGKARVGFKEFPGRTHWIIAEQGWQEVADAALRFAESALSERE